MIRRPGAHRFFLLLGFCGMGGISLPNIASAQSRVDSATAQGLFDEGRKLMAAGNLGEACPKLEESQRLDPGSGTLLNLGICYERQGRLASAWTTLLEAATAAKATGNVNRENAARQRAGAISPQIARLTIRITSSTPGIEVLRDGTSVRAAQWGSAIPTDAGVHSVVVTAPGRKTWQTKVTLKDGASETVIVPELGVSSSPAAKAEKTVVLAPLQSAPDSTKENAGSSFGTQRILALGAGGIGVAGVVVGTVFGLQSMAARDDSRRSDVCDGPACQTIDGVELTNRAYDAGNVSTIGFAIGAAGLVAGAVLWFSAPQGPRVGVGMGTLQVRGSWQ